jgi:hypothetical protein
MEMQIQRLLGLDPQISYRTLGSLNCVPDLVKKSPRENEGHPMIAADFCTLRNLFDTVGIRTPLFGSSTAKWNTSRGWLACAERDQAVGPRVVGDCSTCHLGLKLRQYYPAAFAAAGNRSVWASLPLCFLRLESHLHRSAFLDPLLHNHAPPRIVGALEGAFILHCE